MNEGMQNNGTANKLQAGVGNVSCVLTLLNVERMMGLDLPIDTMLLMSPTIPISNLPNLICVRPPKSETVIGMA